MDVTLQLKVGDVTAPAETVEMVWSAGELPWYVSQGWCTLAHVLFLGAVFRWLLLSKLTHYDYALVKAVDVLPWADPAAAVAATAPAGPGFAPGGAAAWPYPPTEAQ